MKKTKTSEVDSLAMRAAWLHYVGGLTQSMVAERLGLSSVKTHRLIAKAVSEGAVKVIIDGEVGECILLEERLIQTFSLSYCQVAPDVGENLSPNKSLGYAGAQFLRTQLLSKTSKTIGISQGRTIASAIHKLEKIDSPHICFVSLLGGLTHEYAINRNDVLHWLVSKTGAKAYGLPTPLIANSIKDKEVILAQKGIDNLYSMAISAEVKLLGIGTISSATELLSSGTCTEKELDELLAAGAVGEMAGRFFDKDGNVVETGLTLRTLSIPFLNNNDDLVVGIAGGDEKIKAILAVLKSGLLTGLIIDERTAKMLLMVNE